MMPRVVRVDLPQHPPRRLRRTMRPALKSRRKSRKRLNRPIRSRHSSKRCWPEPVAAQALRPNLLCPSKTCAKLCSKSAWPNRAQTRPKPLPAPSSWKCSSHYRSPSGQCFPLGAILLVLSVSSDCPFGLSTVVTSVLAMTNVSQALLFAPQTLRPSQAARGR